MEKFTVLNGLVAPLDRANVDTDAIIPKQFLTSIKRTGYGENLFDAWRYLDAGRPGMDSAKRPLNPDFVLNQARYQGAEILLARGVPAGVVHAILAHADYSGYPRVSLLDRGLYACDELSGFVTACSLVRPGRAIAGLEPGSVKKKLKDKGFARTVNRHDVYRGAEELGVDLDEHIGFVIGALTAVAPSIGLGGPTS